MPTVAAALHEAAGRLRAVSPEDAQLEAEVLLAHALDTSRAHVFAMLHDELPSEARAAFESQLVRRLAHEPLAYITGTREFYGIDLHTAPGALIPRPETEMLVDFAIERARGRGVALRIADVGTGGGAIAVAVAINVPGVSIVAIDLYPEAVAVARRNVERYGLDARIELRVGDLLEGVGTFDLVLANLPYVSEDDWRQVQPEIREHEPRQALVAGPLGTEAVERLLEQLPAHLESGGALAAEIGDTQAARLLAAARARFPQATAYVKKDFAGRDRMLVVETQEAHAGRVA